jgi:hypothetical protein
MFLQGEVAYLRVAFDIPPEGVLPMSDTPRPQPPAAPADDDGLEALADALLWDSEGPAPAQLDYSFHRECSLQRAARRERRCAPPLQPDTSLMRETPAQLLEALFAELELPEMKVRVLSLLRRGLSDRQIATAMGIRLRTATRWRRRTIHLVRRAVRQHLDRLPDAAARRAFLEQAGAYLYTREIHCSPGREACRQDGLCKYRWYLTQEETREW